MVLLEQPLEYRYRFVYHRDICQCERDLGQLYNLALEVEPLTRASHYLITYTLPKRIERDVSIKAILTSLQTPTDSRRRTPGFRLSYNRVNITFDSYLLSDRIVLRKKSLRCPVG